MERQAALLAAGDAAAAAGPMPAAAALAAMEEVGLRCGRGLLRDAPPWLAHFVGHMALYMKVGSGVVQVESLRPVLKPPDFSS